jgi:hypothetical protein
MQSNLWEEATCGRSWTELPSPLLSVTPGLPFVNVPCPHRRERGCPSFAGFAKLGTTDPRVRGSYHLTFQTFNSAYRSSFTSTMPRAGELHRSFVGSPRLRRGLRCLRMTGLGRAAGGVPSGLGSTFWGLTQDLRPFGKLRAGSGLLSAAPFDFAQGRLSGAGPWSLRSTASRR